ncbi:hypothetical protein NDU88_001670 [Pleurodeles waltl]|uniref:Uncharacterized protein n=1 Tax=Pleurodeles waltl TaxID=8319 RepID=A0AAV7R8N4_PLEWA|nr:hypothetical protein NDU88_001670 [Pleurodeles waltl]
MSLSGHGVGRPVATQEKGTEAVERRSRHAVANESIIKERSSIIQVRGQLGPGDSEERQGGGHGAGHGRDGPSATAGSTVGSLHLLVAAITRLKLRKWFLGGRGGPDCGSNAIM